MNNGDKLARMGSERAREGHLGVSFAQQQHAFLGLLHSEEKSVDAVLLESPEWRVAGQGGLHDLNVVR